MQPLPALELFVLYLLCFVCCACLSVGWVASFPIGTVVSDQIISHPLPVLLPFSSHIKSFPTALCSRLPGFLLHCHTHRQGCCPAPSDASGIWFQSYALCLKVCFVRWSCRKGLCECSYHLLCCCSFIWTGCSLWKDCWDCCFFGLHKSIKSQIQISLLHTIA